MTIMGCNNPYAGGGPITTTTSASTNSLLLSSSKQQRRHMLAFPLVALVVVLSSLLFYLWDQSSSCHDALLVAHIKDTTRRTNDNIKVSVIQELFAAVSAERLKSISDKYKQEYSMASPFPHIAIDGIFPEAILQEVMKENPESQVFSGCLHNAKKTCYENIHQNKKSYIEHEDLMGVYTRILFGVMKSSPYLTFLEDISGIEGIIPDPHYLGSGIHVTAPGGSLEIHSDFNKHKPKYALDRRVNSFIYLNDNWNEEYGGHLELWSKDLTQCVQRILPTMGRVVIFSTTDFSYHGHPQPLVAPAGRARRSMALYYYTNGRPSHECYENDCAGTGRTTFWKHPVGCTKCEQDQCRAYDDSHPSWVTVESI